MAKPRSEELLAEDMARFVDDPLGFVQYAYKWGVGELDGFLGPDEWQEEFLTDLGRESSKRQFDGVDAVSPIRMATASGHGIGKSALTAWLIDWIMSTRPFAKGVVTANTAPQLQTKTWAELTKWTKRCVTGHWFEVRVGRGAMSMTHKLYPEQWRVDGQTCREENSEAFAGLHAVNSTPFYIFDEASAVPDSIWDVAEGGLTDGEPMQFVFGNPTRNTGRFFQCFHGRKHRYKTRQIDSRTVRITNKELIKEWETDFGEDSDFFRVRVRGVFPRASAFQFIDRDVAAAARMREDTFLPGDPLIMGVDVARGGDDQCVIQFRRGMSARSLTESIPAARMMPGEVSRDSMRLVSWVLETARQFKPDFIFVDATGLGGPIADRLRQINLDAIDVGFGEKSPDAQCANMRSYMWTRMKEWLNRGGAIDDSEELETDLIAPEFHHNSKDQVVLESKEHMKDQRGLASPDRGDALALTFAQPVFRKEEEQLHSVAEYEYDPFSSRA